MSSTRDSNVSPATESFLLLSFPLLLGDLGFRRFLAGWAGLRVRETSFAGALICFHFFLLMLALRLLGEPWLNLIAEEMCCPCRVGAGLALL